MENKLGCKAWQLEPGTEFSLDEGRTWVTCITVADARDNDDTIVNYRTDDGTVNTWRGTGWTHVLLERNWKG